MKVLWISPDYPSSHFPFAGLYSQMQARALREQDVIPQVVSPIPFVPPILKKLNARYKMMAELPRHSMDGTISVIRPRYLTTLREYILKLSHITQRISILNIGLSKPDLIHAHFAYPVGAAAIGLAKKWKVPVVITLHGDDVTIHPHISGLHRRYFTKTIQSANLVVAVSKALAQETEKLTGRKPRVLSVGIDPIRFQSLPDKLQERKQLELPADGFVILYIGNMVTQKGVLDLTAAFSRLDGNAAQLIYVGEGPQKPQGDRIIHFGFRFNRDIPKFLAVADLMVLPSHHEGLGQVILEAGASGVPVIGAATGGIVELLSDRRGWLFQPKNIDALLACLNEVRSHPAEAAKRAQRLKNYVLEKHVLKRNAIKLKKFYENIL